MKIVSIDSLVCWPVITTWFGSNDVVTLSCFELGRRFLLNIYIYVYNQSFCTISWPLLCPAGHSNTLFDVHMSWTSLKAVYQGQLIYQFMNGQGAGLHPTHCDVFYWQPWDDNSACEDPCSFIPTPNKEEDDELEYPKTAFQPRKIRPPRASPLPVLK